MNKLRKIYFGLGLLGAGIFLGYTLNKPPEIEKVQYETRPENSEANINSPLEYLKLENNQLKSKTRHKEDQKLKTPQEIFSDVINRQLSKTLGQKSASEIKYGTETEFFPVDNYDDRNDLVALFKEDCEGNCIYLRGEEGITKLLLKKDEEMILYDSQFESHCFRLIGDNVWVYLDESGEISAWGRGAGQGSIDGAYNFYPLEECK